MLKTTGTALGLALLATTALASGTVTNTSGTTNNKGHTRGAAATEFQITDLVSDQDGIATTTDPDLINAWGVAKGGPGGPIWVSDNGTGKSTVYDSAGVKQSLTVSIVNGDPTGVVFVKPNASGDTIFPLTQGGVTGSSVFIFATENGQIEGWNPNVNATSSVIAIDNSAGGANYKGIGISNHKEELFAANFVKNKVEVYDQNFALVNTFKDKSLPAHFGPFNVMVDENSVYVAFAQHSKDGDEVKGAGLGYIDVFRKDGHLKTHLVANGALNAPWGMAIAPSTFGEFAGALLVGNFGDGKINAYDKNTGEFLGALSDSTGAPIVIDGLWGIEARPLGKITFAAGPGDEAHGLLGSITPITQTAQK